MSLHPQAQAYLAQAQASAPAEPMTVEQEREHMRALALSAPRIGLDYVADVDASGVPCRLYRPRPGAPVALYVHGGGWMFHDLDTHDAFCRYLAHQTGWALLAVGYRLAPEHPFPAPLDDVETAAAWLREHARSLRTEASFLPAIGDSAGANLIAGLCVRDPEALDFQVLLYPPTDRRAPLDTVFDNPAFGAHDMEIMWQAYAPGPTGDDPQVSVLRAHNLAEHPPALVVTCEYDVLRDQGEQYAAALADAGVSVVAHRALGMVHSFWRQPEVFDASGGTVAMVGALLDDHRARFAARWAG
jgi:acetyl esterase